MLRLDVPRLSVGEFDVGLWRPEQAQALVDAWHDPAVLLGAEPPVDRSLESALRWIDGTELRAAAALAIDAVVTQRSSGEVCGEVGLSSIQVERRAALVGWWVAASRRGEGIATAMVTAFSDWAIHEAGYAALLAQIAPDNTASIIVAERAGFSLLKDSDSADQAAVFVRH